MQVILLSYPGVDGEVSIAGYTNMVACQSIGLQNVTNTFDSPPTAPDRTSGGSSWLDDDDPSPNVKSSGKTGADESKRVGDLSVTRIVDQATPSFMQMAFQTKQGTATAIFVVFRAFETGLSDLSIDSAKVSGSMGSTSNVLSFGLLDTPTFWHKPFLTITLTGCSIGSHSISITESDMTEDVTINFKKLQMQYTVFTNGVKSGNVLGSIDLTQESSSSGGL